MIFDFSNTVDSILHKKVENDPREKKGNDIKIFTISRNFGPSSVEKNNADILTINVPIDLEADKIPNYQNTKAAHLKKIEIRYELLNKLLHECSKETCLHTDHQRRMRVRKIMIEKLLRHYKKDEEIYRHDLEQLINMEEGLVVSKTICYS